MSTPLLSKPPGGAVLVGSHKQCTACGWFKTLDDFPNDKSRPSGKFPQCKACNYGNVTKWRKDNPEKYRDLTSRTNKKPRTLERKREWERQRKTTMKRLYGIDGDQYRQMLADQDFCCAICKRHKDESTRELAVDHDHDTGKVRGLLCLKCNVGLGSFGDDIGRMKAATAYLEAHE